MAKKRQWKFISELSANTCVVCRGRHNQKFDEDQVDMMPPVHFAKAKFGEKGERNCNCRIEWLDPEDDDEDKGGGGDYIPKKPDDPEDVIESKFDERLLEEAVKLVEKFKLERKMEKKSKKKHILKKIRDAELTKKRRIKQFTKESLKKGLDIDDVNKILETTDIKKLKIDPDLEFTSGELDTIKDYYNKYQASADKDGNIKIEKKREEERKKSRPPPKYRTAEQVKMAEERKQIELDQGRAKSFLTQEELQRDLDKYELDEYTQEHMNLREEIVEKNPKFDWIKQMKAEREGIGIRSHPDDPRGEQMVDPYSIEMAYVDRINRRDDIAKKFNERAISKYIKEKKEREATEELYKEMDKAIMTKDEIGKIGLEEHRRRRQKFLEFKERNTEKQKALKKYEEKGQLGEARKIVSDIESDIDFGDIGSRKGTDLERKRRRSTEKGGDISMLNKEEIEQFKLNLFQELREFTDNLKIKLSDDIEDDIKEFMTKQAEEIGIPTPLNIPKEERSYISSLNKFFETNDKRKKTKEENDLIRMFDIETEGFEPEPQITSGEEIKPDKTKGGFNQAEITQIQNRVSDLTKRVEMVSSDVQRNKQILTTLKQYREDHQRVHGDYNG